MTHPAITTEIHQTLNAHRYRAAQIALNGDLRDFESNQIDLGVGKIFNLDRTGDAGLQANAPSHRATNPEDRGQPDFDVLLIRNIDVRYKRHGLYQPCRCLWVGSGQITRTTRLRRTILQLRHIFFTDVLTFIAISGYSPA